MKKLVLFISILIFCLGLPSLALISSTELINNAEKHDGEIIEYEGEVIGDVMRRGKNGWINVSDGKAALGIWAPRNLLNKIKITGDYNYIGDKVRIKGVFFRASAQHGGDLMIEASDLTVIDPGHKVKHEIQHGKIVIAIILAIGILILVIPKKLFEFFRR